MARIDLATQFADVRTRVATQPTAPVEASASDGPKYRRFTRKETLLRADQLADLAALARYRMKQRRVRVERITENSLVRIAVDLLLDNQDLLHGSTEAELAESIMRIVAVRTSLPAPTGATAEGPDAAGSEVRDLQSAELPNIDASADPDGGSPS